MRKDRNISTALKFPLLLFLSLTMACHHTAKTVDPLPGPGDYPKISEATPYLIVERDGVTFIPNGLAQNIRTHLQIEEVATYLRNLPPEAWPDGKIIRLGDNPLRSGNDNLLIAQNRAKIDQILKSLQIKTVLLQST